MRPFWVKAEHTTKGSNVKTQHHITRISKNVKTGPMSLTRTDTSTCPNSCPLLGNGCYDQSGNGNIHRTRVDAGKYTTMGFKDFLKAIRDLTSVYRHNEGGDLWNGKTPEHICADSLKQFSEVNKAWRKRAIVYTHKALVGKRAHWAIRKANRQAIESSGSNVAINASVESLAEVDEALELGLDAVCVLPSETKGRRTTTPKGKLVVTCPAYYSKTQCSPLASKPCGSGKPLCSRKNRGYAIGFPAHGAKKKHVSLNIIN